MIGLDSNILIRLAVRDDENQFKRARKILKSVEADHPAYINLIVLAEFCWTLNRAYKVPERGVCSAVTKLLDAKNVIIAQREAIVQSLLLSASSGCGLSDALIASVNRLEGCKETLTFDRRFAGTGAARLVNGNET
ncbi:PIN domain-containing protein [soil metagenome]